jgi:hypothetical protein
MDLFWYLVLAGGLPLAAFCGPRDLKMRLVQTAEEKAADQLWLDEGWGLRLSKLLHGANVREPEQHGEIDDARSMKRSP